MSEDAGRIACCILLLLVFSQELAKPASSSSSEEEKAAKDRKVLLLWQQQESSNGRQRNPCGAPAKSRKEKGATILEIKRHGHRSSTCSGSNWSNKHPLRQHAILFASDDARVKYIHSRYPHRISSKTSPSTALSSAAQIPLTSGIKLQTLNYVVTITLGGRESTVIVDTGSDLTWVQCRPCLYCYAQQDPLFDPTVSPSYHPVPCNSTPCASLGGAASSSIASCGPARPTCSYALGYGDGSYTRGDLATDRLTLGGDMLDGFVFGCGRTNRGLFGGAAGLMGLGRSPLSLVAQAGPQFGGTFSYCLPARNYDASGSLALGGDASVYRNTTPVAYTGVIQSPPSPFFPVNLTGVSVGGVQLQGNSGFAGGGGSRVIVDSGTVITRLPPSVYAALRTEFLKQFTGHATTPGFSILDTCFDLAGFKEVDVPTVRLHFDGGAEVTVDVAGMFYFVKKDASQVCLAFAALTYEGQLGIIGNYQQKNLRVVYDTLGSRVGFAQETCTYN